MKNEEYIINEKAYYRRAEIYRQLCLGNKINIKDYAYWLRANSTNAEDTMKDVLNKIGIRYYFQYVIDPFIVDFCYRKYMLVIEVDGPYHNKEYDLKRDTFLKKKNYNILRFDLEDLYFKTDITERIIREKLTELMKKKKNKTLF